MRALVLIVSLLAVAGAAAGVYWGSYGYFLSEERAKAQGRLSLYRSTVVAELERFSHLTYVLARDPYVIETAQTGGAEALNPRLAAFAGKAGLDAIYLIRPDGETIAASNAGTEISYVGKNYAFRPYFAEAMAGRQGRFYGIGTTTGLPGYFIADAVRGPGGRILGAVAMKLELDKLEENWRAAGEEVFLTNSDGVVLLASDPAWQYKVLQPLTPRQVDRIHASRQFPGQPLEPLDWQPLPDRRVQIGGQERLHLAVHSLPHGWSLHYFTSGRPAAARSLLLTGALVIAAALVLIATQTRRARQISAALRRSEANEAQLREANDRLAVEIEERRAAERRLRRTRGELERASRLAALGQLAASVTHELGQPIAAMRNHLAAAEISGNGTATLPRVAGLVERMEGITRQLKFFARTESDGFGEVDLCAAMQAALELVAPNLAGTGITPRVSGPQTPVIVRGNQLRIEQVMTNILRNAIDALEDSGAPELAITIGQSGSAGWFEAADNGHGFGGATLSDLQEPFVTTRESGKGMGLGLAISAAIIKEHRGRLSARPRPGGGALFRVEIPLPETEDAPAS